MNDEKAHPLVYVASDKTSDIELRFVEANGFSSYMRCVLRGPVSALGVLFKWILVVSDKILIRA